MIHRKSKLLYSTCIDGVQTHIRCRINLNSEHISITTQYQLMCGWKGGMHKNTECGLYLGVHIGEKVLSKIFPNIKIMPPRNTGYDFIWNGYKIDAKTACLTEKSSTQWHYLIKKNKIPDYFLCLAFNNRINLTPLHVWFIPAIAINHLTGTSISISTINKWDIYKIDKLNNIESEIKKHGWRF